MLCLSCGFVIGLFVCVVICLSLMLNGWALAVVVWSVVVCMAYFLVGIWLFVWWGEFAWFSVVCMVAGGACFIDAL